MSLAKGQRTAQWAGYRDHPGEISLSEVLWPLPCRRVNEVIMFPSDFKIYG